MITSEMKGNLPPFNDWMGHLSEGNHLYMFGGCRPNDTKPTSDFYLCDIRSMEWTNLTVRCLHPRATLSDSQSRLKNTTRFLSNPMNRDPFADQHNPVTKPLPRLHKPALASFHVGQKKFMLLFGGRIKKTLSSELIALDIHELTWFVVQMEGASVVSRMSPIMVTIDRRIFIFGGCGEDGEILNTYCVAEYTQPKWRWIVRDEPYPGHVPSLGLDLDAASVFGGKKILLTAGRDNDADVSLNTTSFL